MQLITEAAGVGQPIVLRTPMGSLQPLEGRDRAEQVSGLVEGQVRASSQHFFICL